MSFFLSLNSPLNTPSLVSHTHLIKADTVKLITECSQLKLDHFRSNGYISTEERRETTRTAIFPFWETEERGGRTCEANVVWQQASNKTNTQTKTSPEENRYPIKRNHYRTHHERQFHHIVQPPTGTNFELLRFPIAEQLSGCNKQTSPSGKNTGR